MSCDSVILEVKVVPGASQTEVAGWEGERVRIRIAAPPEKGKANKELVHFLSKRLGVSRTKIAVISGATSRIKRVEIEGLEEVRSRL
jgi:uncharacterized protein